MQSFDSILFLDDVRVPKSPDVQLVRSYGEFVDYLKKNGVPDLISFDHDLAMEHYPLGENRAGQKVPYSSYRQETGLHCAQYVVENRLPLRHWAVHSSNVQGRINIERELRRYHRRGEVRGFVIPFAVKQSAEPVEEMEEISVAAPSRDRRFSSTSLFQFEEDMPLEDWELGLMRSFARG